MGFYSEGQCFLQRTLGLYCVHVCSKNVSGDSPRSFKASLRTSRVPFMVEVKLKLIPKLDILFKDMYSVYCIARNNIIGRELNLADWWVGDYDAELIFANIFTCTHTQTHTHTQLKS